MAEIMTKQYLVVYAKVPESNFAGMSPDVLGCVSTGDTLEAIRLGMREALEFHIESIVEDGEVIPEPHTTSIDLADGDFDGVEYFVIEHLEIVVPQAIVQAAVSAA